ncbi:hypothetical protein [Bifidobacterium sp. ESL0820]|uniref:hypothetical protein n=1 Tax=Bifidobacterium sp. ESL0820 TaxID=3448586 RepID=UPI004042D71F
MHTITVEISKAIDQLGAHGWQKVSVIRRSSTVNADDPDQMQALRNLCQQMDQRTAEDPARIARTVNSNGVVYEFGAYHATDIASIMSQAGIHDWERESIPDVSGVAIRMSLD